VGAPLRARIEQGITRSVDPAVAAFARHLAEQAGALAVLFYGSNLRTGELDGVLDYYLLTDGAPERGIWPRVSYHEWAFEGAPLRAKVATMTLTKFSEAASGRLLDTTIWARFVQPSALVWCSGDAARQAVVTTLCEAGMTAARLAVAVGRESGLEADYWTALFEATYRAEFRVETAGRARSIIELNASHFDGLLPLALDAAGIGYEVQGARLSPRMTSRDRRATRRWWAKRRRMGKPLNLLRLVRAASTFEGAARYAAWKIERHTGVLVPITPWREGHPVLAAPGVLWQVWRARRRRP
jgi:hypothetical protein